MKIVAIIPARGGSKRIPRKNIRSFNGLPMIAWSIESAIQSGCFDRVIVSTDDQEIAQIADSYGAETPFIRPASISDDHSTSSDVMAHAINYEASHGRDIDFACCIYPTSPFIKIENLTKGLELIQSGKFEYVFTASTYSFPIERSFSFSEMDGLKMIFPKKEKVRSQDLQDIFHDAGQFYWGKANNWKNLTPIFSKNSLPLILPRSEVVDIDTEEDWEEAEIKFKLLKENQA
ncbi:pseudaminic acid cytidylyltransferase [Gammaproteobacteria bacterium]|nr:pseudaminic acid cytidylyltransferase [Gammaproteobacteria bacterium]MDA8798639.1 pseudaminic acid cytidylyltransferase [Gammaproteobacteria bacterium]MDC0919295.1 pseudaminic acid cytidylyltransferase [Gammaproteobacteria bacterium]